MAYAAACSTHPVTAHATGEVIGQVLERVGRYPDLAVVVVSRGHAGALEDVTAAVDVVLHPAALLGAASELPAAGTGPAPPSVGLWAGTCGPVATVALDPATAGDALLHGPEPAAGLVLLADPHTFDTAAWLCGLGGPRPGLAVVGGLVAGAEGRGGARLFAEGRVLTGGAVAAVVGPAAGLRPLEVTGLRPVGPPVVVTRAERAMVYELDGMPAYSRLEAMARDGAPAADLRLINDSLHLGGLLVLGRDPSNGALALDGSLEAGAQARFEVRDPVRAQQELLAQLAGRSDCGALVFAGAGAGTAPQPECPSAAAVLSVPTAGQLVAGTGGPRLRRGRLVAGVFGPG